jgi:hypothetical protein
MLSVIIQYLDYYYMDILKKGGAEMQDYKIKYVQVSVLWIFKLAIILIYAV